MQHRSALLAHLLPPDIALKSGGPGVMRLPEAADDRPGVVLALLEDQKRATPAEDAMVTNWPRR